MEQTCADCEQSVSYRNIETQTVFNDGEFVTVYRCPHCGEQMDGVEADP